MHPIAHLSGNLEEPRTQRCNPGYPSVSKKSFHHKVPPPDPVLRVRGGKLWWVSLGAFHARHLPSPSNIHGYGCKGVANRGLPIEVKRTVQQM